MDWVRVSRDSWIHVKILCNILILNDLIIYKTAPFKIRDVFFSTKKKMFPI